ncbi:hypothetical protein KAI04_03050 [Candidatus Pacearchaeota archaeon]|nr:hypothetical protein [Candidatus Pacearchaeota archaeon]
MKNLIKRLTFVGLLALTSCNEDPSYEIKVNIQNKTNKTIMVVTDPSTNNKLSAEDSDNDGELDNYFFSPLENNSVRDYLNKYNCSPQEIYGQLTREE